MIDFTFKKKVSLGKNYLYRCTAAGLRRRFAPAKALRDGRALSALNTERSPTTSDPVNSRSGWS